ncbi:MAG: tryptophan synthase subunit alpha [Ignavibacteriae bacterium]|nr:tryptophan synthase subunit alpha [Ignavibacteriota bacterium]NOG97448.1 tryptophan synthase subunit alpha [Ignavibacteriota bacterium]
MSKIAEHIEALNKKGRKALTIFLTAGYPNKNSFTDAAKAAVDSGADILEIGVPFGDSLADGPVIQSSYYKALEENINIKDVLKFVEEIKSEKNISIVIMGSSNPINNYGTKNFINDAKNSGAEGIIVPDVTLEEYDDFFAGTNKSIDKILLTTPTSSEDRIRSIDKMSSGFVYCVSVLGTTGVRSKFDETVIKNLARTYSIVKKNKLQIGFGISSGEDVRRFKNYCDGVIVGSAVVKLLNEKNGIELSSKLISELSNACLIE